MCRDRLLGPYILMYLSLDKRREMVQSGSQARDADSDLPCIPLPCAGLMSLACLVLTLFAHGIQHLTCVELWYCLHFSQRNSGSSVILAETMRLQLTLPQNLSKKGKNPLRKRFIFRPRQSSGVVIGLSSSSCFLTSGRRMTGIPEERCWSVSWCLYLQRRVYPQVSEGFPMTGS